MAIPIKYDIRDLEDLKYSSCTGKKRYNKPQEIINVLKRIEKENTVYHKYVNIYQCPFCNGWHFGKSYFK